ncbi:MAG: hypothetical protein B7Z37_28075 [Verrucomicrobia bacterium 12-59-8]|nr:MAG: hypothetical protein B7Z37_28075 [Verrucomicrobia bacterium 12-59-8]
MNAVYNSHILKWKNVNWPEEERRLLESIQSCKGKEVLAKVRQGDRLVELPSPNGNFSRRLQLEKINLKAGFDLELITREPCMAGHGQPAVEPERPEDFVDRADYNALQWNGERGTGTLVSNRMRNTPMFFRHNGMNADVMDLYAGQTLFLVLNGGSLEGFDWSRLKKPGICTFGVNNGAHVLRPTFWTSVDDPTRFLRSIWQDPTITKFIPMSHFQKPVWDESKNAISKSQVKDFPNVYGYRRNEAFQAAQWLYEDTINWGNHGKRGGGRSVMLAALRIAFLLGFRRVCLLGCDFYMDDNNRYWFAEQRSKQAISNNQNSYRIMMSYFDELQPHFLNAGFHVVNCNPKSHLKAFPMADLEEELRAAQVDTGATTVGMYVDRYKETKPAAPKPNPPPPAAPKGAAAPKGVSPAYKTSRPAAVSPGSGRRMEAKTLGQMISVIRASPLQHQPFAHMRLESMIPEDIYQELLENLPDRRCYIAPHRTPGAERGADGRLRLGLSSSEISRLQGGQQKFWSQMRTVLHDPRLESALRMAMRSGLRQRFGGHADSLKFQPRAELLHDPEGYCGGIHSGTSQQALILELHLPQDCSQSDSAATRYFRRSESGAFVAEKTLDFTPRSGHAFVAGDSSYHGLESTMTEDRHRNALLVTYEIK